MQHVTAVGRVRSFARAAASLGISQPALSKSIRSIENALGVRLFERGRFGARPTAFGEIIISRSPSLIEGAEDVLGEIRRMKGLEAGSIRVGAGPFPYALSVGSAAVHVARRHPTLQVRVVHGDWEALTRDVRNGHLDVAVAEVAAGEQDASLAVERIGSHAGIFYCRAGHPLLSSPRPSVEDLFRYPLALNELPARIAQVFDPLSPAGRRDPVSGRFLPAITLDSVALMKQAVAETDALSWAPEVLLSAELLAGTFVALPFAPPWARLDYGVIRRGDRPMTPAVEIFLAELRTEEKRVCEAGARKGVRPRRSRSQRER